MKTLLCAKCKTVMAEIENGRVRKDIVVLCPKCAYPQKKPDVDAPEFMKEMFGL